MTTRTDLRPQRTNDSFDDKDKVQYDLEGKRVDPNVNPVMAAPETPNTFMGTMKYMFDW
jgi:hypothetical protein